MRTEFKGFRIGDLIITTKKQIRESHNILEMNEVTNLIKDWIKIRRYLREQNKVLDK